jgi:hypothetical protein
MSSMGVDTSNTGIRQASMYFSIKYLLDVQFPTKLANQSGCVQVFSLTEAATISCEQCIESVICYDDAIINIIRWSEETPTNYIT